MLTLLEAPADFITLEDAKDHVSVSHDRDDALIQGKIAAAIAYLDGPDGYLGAAIASQKWRWTVGAFSELMRFPIGPVITIESVSYRNEAGGVTIVDPADYYLFGDSEGPYLRPVSAWPIDVANRDDTVSIEYTAGRLAVPESLRSAALILVGQLYLHREQDVDVRVFETSFGFHDLARPYRASVVL